MTWLAAMREFPCSLECPTNTSVAGSHAVTFFAGSASHGQEVTVNIERLTTPWWSLRVVLGAAAFLAGLDKFFNLLADWPAYLSPIVTGLLPVGASTFMHVIGVVEMAVGALILAGY